MVRFSKRAEDADRDPGPRAAGDRYANRETAAGLFSRPPPPIPPKPPPIPPHPAPARHEPEPQAPQLSIRPLREPAPAVTTIRVEPVPIDGFEFETAAPWCSDPPPEPPRPPVPRPAPRPIFEPLAPRPERRTITWLDE
ncbi:hypothetical protein ABT369_42015 [Dactylosporangium sp. NPDC000244]|uniref:hypothetical protein n=1 Tax=Dactylosporangium sp. NPDC000244 TaxID=3154365 RepID=UPI0033304557